MNDLPLFSQSASADIYHKPMTNDSPLFSTSKSTPMPSSTPSLKLSSCSYNGFSGVNDIEPTFKKSASSGSTYKLKNIFNPKKSKRRRIRSKSHKIRKQSKSKKSVKKTEKKKILWRPSLEIMFKDKLLLNSLIAHSEQQYNSENILFLISIRELINGSNANINDQIESIYNLYIVASAKCKINLSYACYMDAISKISTFRGMTQMEKYKLFDICVKEIERLMLVSVLPSFYNSKCFQGVAEKSKYYKEYKPLKAPQKPSLGLNAFSSDLCILSEYETESEASIKQSNVKTKSNGNHKSFLAKKGRPCSTASILCYKRFDF